MSVPLATQDVGHIPMWLGYIGLFAFMILAIYVGGLREKKKRDAGNQSLWEWSQKSGVLITFGDPPPEAKQRPRALLEVFKASDNPFFHPSYDLDIFGQNLFQGIVEGRKTWMMLGARHLGKNSTYPEAWIIVELQRDFPSGEVDRPTAGIRPFGEPDYRRIDFNKSGLRAQAKDPDEFKPILETHFFADLLDSGATGFRIRGRYLEVSFDGNATQDDWTARTPVVAKLASTLEAGS